MNTDDLVRYSVAGLRFQDSLKPKIAAALEGGRQVEPADLFSAKSYDLPVVFGELELNLHDVEDLVTEEPAVIAGFGKYMLPFHKIVESWYVDLDKHPDYDILQETSLHIRILERLRNIVDQADAGCWILHNDVYVNSVFNLTTPRTKLSYCNTEICVEIKLAAGRFVD